MPSNKPISNSGTALLAEDDAMVRELVCTYLEELGYHVLEARNGKQAIDLLDANGTRLDLIVTDLVMPQASGADVVQFARKAGKCERILIISGFAEDLKFVENSVRDGSEFLSKPFTFNDFEKKISYLQEHFN